MSFKDSIIRASMWSSLTEIVAKVISPLVFLVLTRILSPTDFGLVAVATTLLSFAYVVSDMGTSKVLIQFNGSKEEIDSMCDIAFWFNLTVGLILFFCTFFCANFIASFYEQENSALVIRVMSFQIVFYSLSSVQNALRRRNLDFKFLFYIRLATIGTPALFSIPIALAGGGFWAIVIGSVIGSFLTTLVLWYMSDWKPKFFFSFYILRNLFSKSVWNTLEQFFVWIPIGLDAFLISKFLSVKELGLYSTSRTMFTTATGLLLAPLLPVLFSSLSKMLGDHLQFRKMVFLSHKIIFSIAIFMGVTVWGFRDYIENLFFNNKWDGISSVFGVMFLIMCFEYFYSAVVESLRANGCFKYLALNTILSISITIPMLYYSVSEGLVAYVVVRGLALYLYFPGVFYLSAKECGITFKQCIYNVKTELILLLIYGLLVYAIACLSLSSFVNFLLLILLLLSFIAFYYVKEKVLFNNILALLKKKKS